LLVSYGRRAWNVRFGWKADLQNNDQNSPAAGDSSGQANALSPPAATSARSRDHGDCCRRPLSARLHGRFGFDPDALLRRLRSVRSLDDAQTHRSWWVVPHTVCHVSRNGGRSLAFELDVTVSRTHAPRLRQLG
jgi:hypothetical protein